MNRNHSPLNTATQKAETESIETFEFYVKELEMDKAVKMSLESTCLTKVKNYILDRATKHSTLTSWLITTSTGYNWSTSMAPSVTQEQAEKYFLNKRFNVGVYPHSKIETVVKVTSLN